MENRVITMNLSTPNTISLEWLEKRYGFAAAQDIFDQIVRADTVANDCVKDVNACPKISYKGC